jgi:endonuclease YncB( thermonuclease family)
MSQAYGEEARETLDRRVYRRTVRVAGSKTDRYGRVLADLYMGPEWINRELVERGAAWNYSSPADARLASAQQVAAAERRGLWREPHPIPPRQWRQQHPRP